MKKEGRSACDRHPSHASALCPPTFLLPFEALLPFSLSLSLSFFLFLSLSLALTQETPRGTPNTCVALNDLFADMRMSSSMYEVFNWNSSPDPPLTPAKHKRASLSLPPTTDIFAVDDKSDSDTRRPMIQRAASGES